MMAMKRLSSHALSPRSEFAINVDEYRKQAEDEHIDEHQELLYGHPASAGGHSRNTSAASPTSPQTSRTPLDGPAVPPKDGIGSSGLLSATDALERTKISD